MLLGYNTNGLGHQDVVQAVTVLADLGYHSVAITLDHQSLNPYGDVHVFYRQLDGIQSVLQKCKMRSVVEIQNVLPSSRAASCDSFLLSGDPDEWAQSIGFLTDAIDVVKALGSDCLSFSSGPLTDGVSLDEGFERLVAGLDVVLDYADGEDVTIGFVPGPDNFIDTLAQFEQLVSRVDAPHFKLTLDVGHLHCQGEVPIADHIRRWASQLVNVHLEDMRAGVHQHLMFGQGEIEFPPIIDALIEVGYRGAVHVDLDQYQREGVQAARQAFEFLNSLMVTD